MTNESLTALLNRAEIAIDLAPDLTRVRPSGLEERAELSFSEGIWQIRLKVRNQRATGRGSRSYYDAHGEGETPGAAVASFLERLPFFVESTR
jgi:hypothetical protein